MVQKTWKEKIVVALLLIYMKGTLDHILIKQLITHMVELEIDRNLVLWTRSFLVGRKLPLVIDGHENMKREIETRIP